MSKTYKASMAFPRDNYVIRCTGDEFGRSTKDNAMSTLNFEIDNPEEVEIGGEMVNVAGAKTQPVWLVTQVFDNGELDVERTTKAIARCNEWLATAGLPALDNPENPTLNVKGKLFHARCFGKSEEIRKAPTVEQKAAGKPGDIIKNPITGEPEVRYTIVIEKVYGPAEGNPNKPY